jgi:hypothetical protein
VVGLGRSPSPGDGSAGSGRSRPPAPRPQSSWWIFGKWRSSTGNSYHGMVQVEVHYLNSWRYMKKDRMLTGFYGSSLIHSWFQIPVRKPDETGWRGWMWIFLARFRVDQKEIHHLAAVIPVQFPNSLDEFPIGGMGWFWFQLRLSSPDSSRQMSKISNRQSMSRLQNSSK